MESTNPNHFDKNYSSKVIDARKFVKKLVRESGIFAVAHFDLTGSTKKMQIDQEGTITEMLTHNKICRNIIEENGGTVIKELGDAILATYPNAPKACQCALNVIHNFKKYGKGIVTKVTITAGTLEKVKTAKEPDVYGVPVNLCNRMSKHASKDSIVIEEKRYEDIKSWLPKDERINFCRPKKVKLDDFKPTTIRKITLNC